MQHRYPFTVLHFQIKPEFIDVNVHPQKMEIRFTNERELYKTIYDCITARLTHREFIPEVTFEENKNAKDTDINKSAGIPVDNKSNKNACVTGNNESNKNAGITGNNENNKKNNSNKNENSSEEAEKIAIVEKKVIDVGETLSRIGKVELHRPDAYQKKQMFAELMKKKEKQ